MPFSSYLDDTNFDHGLEVCLACLGRHPAIVSVFCYSLKSCQLRLDFISLGFYLSACGLSLGG